MGQIIRYVRHVHDLDHFDVITDSLDSYLKALMDDWYEFAEADEYD